MRLNRTLGLFGDVRPIRNGNRNKLLDEDRPAHEWYRFILSFPPHLVREYTHRFSLNSRTRVLDPFCGTGTTLVECKKLGIPSLGFEAHPMAALASKVKTNWGIDAGAFRRFTRRISQRAKQRLACEDGNLRTLPEEAHSLLLKNSISPLPLHKTLILEECLGRASQSPFYEHAVLALANALVKDIGNLHFGPEVGTGKIKEDVDAIGTWVRNALQMAADLSKLRARARVRSRIWLHDSRTALAKIPAESIDAVITSPPYPNEKDYTRTTRLETVLLGFIKNKKDLRLLKQGLLRSNTRNVYKSDDDDLWVQDFGVIGRLADEIEGRRIALGKTSGFERQYARVTKLYFGGMARHFAALRRVLRPGARLGYIVGDQASYLQVMIRTGQILGEIAESLGYEVESLDLFRTRLATATRKQLREEVLVLRWPGRSTRFR